MGDDTPRPALTVSAALRRAEARLRGAHVAEAALDAEFLLRHVLGWDRARVLAEGRSPLPDSARERFEILVAERATRRPLQHLVGRQAFWRHEFLVSPAVLVPRPETELLVEAALALAPRGGVVVDVGTGSGNIAVSLALERPDLEVHATDVSQEALEVARQNAVRLGAPGIRFWLGDLLAPLAGQVAAADLVVSNPPYVEAEALAGLEPEVRGHDPLLALVSPEGPLPLYGRLATESARLLRPGGRLAVEIGQGQQDGVVAACGGAGLVVERELPDLRSIPRIVIARRP